MKKNKEDKQGIREIKEERWRIREIKERRKRTKDGTDLLRMGVS